MKRKFSLYAEEVFYVYIGSTTYMPNSIGLNSLSTPPVRAKRRKPRSVEGNIVVFRRVIRRAINKEKGTLNQMMGHN